MGWKENVQKFHILWGGMVVGSGLISIALRNYLGLSTWPCKKKLKYRKIAQTAEDVFFITSQTQALSQLCFGLRCPLTLLETRCSIPLVGIPLAFGIANSMLKWNKLWLMKYMNEISETYDGFEVLEIVELQIQKITYCIHLSFLAKILFWNFFNKT